jgi:hypothetical protein
MISIQSGTISRPDIFRLSVNRTAAAPVYYEEDPIG